MAVLVKYLPSLLPVILMVVSLAAPAVSSFFGSHADWTVVGAALYSVLTHLLPSPVTGPKVEL